REEAARGIGRVGHAELLAVKEVRRLQHARQAVLQAGPEVLQHAGGVRRDPGVLGDLVRGQVAAPRAAADLGDERARAGVVGGAPPEPAPPLVPGRLDWISPWAHEAPRASSPAREISFRRSATGHLPETKMRTPQESLTPPARRTDTRARTGPIEIRPRAGE